MKTSEIMEMQARIRSAGFYRGEIDGLWGPRSNTGLRKYLVSLMPTPNPWPTQARVADFFGRPGDESNLVAFDFPYPTFYGGKRVKTGRCHRLVRDSLLRVLTEIGFMWGKETGIMEEAEDYGGIYNDRNMRSGASKSMHAWGIAIDQDADDNGNSTPWPQKADMPLAILEAFAREGWTSAAAWWGRDAMHHQATRPF